MSLLLRKECQETLDDVGLFELHVSVKNKTLTILGECGKPIVSISGIQFASTSPKKLERDYAVLLFNEFINKNKKAILELVHEKKELIKLNKAVIPSGFRSYGTYLIRDNIKLFESGEIEINKKFLFTDLNEVRKQIEKCIKDTGKYFDDLRKYKKKEKEISELSKKVMSCDI